MSEITVLNVDEELEGSRLDVFLAEQLQNASRSFLQKLIKDGKVHVNKKAQKANYRVQAGDHLEVMIPDPLEANILPEDIPLDILYEDCDLLVVNKPKDMVVHPCPGHFSGTLVNALMFHCKDELSGINGVMRPGIVHRIDKNTTGSLLVCKTDAAHRKLAEHLKVHDITRKYRAIVHGNIKDDIGTVDAPIGRSRTDRKKMAVDRSGGGREAITHYTVLERFGKYTYIECRLETGRTHQIRVHMSSIGHPILGDDVYGPSKCPYMLQGQTLHAMVLGFEHPTTGKYMEFSAPLPTYFNELLEKFRRSSDLK